MFYNLNRVLFTFRLIPQWANCSKWNNAAASGSQLYWHVLSASGHIVVAPLAIWQSHLFPPQEQQRLANKQQTDHRQQLFQLRSIKASIKQQDQKTKTRQRQRKDNQEAQKAQPRRLGKLKYIPPIINIRFYMLNGYSSSWELHFLLSWGIWHRPKWS